MSTDTLSVEQHLEWLLCAIETSHFVITQSDPPGRLPQFRDQSRFRSYLERHLDDARRHAWAIKQALPATSLTMRAPWPP